MAIFVDVSKEPVDVAKEPVDVVEEPTCRFGSLKVVLEAISTVYAKVHLEAPPHNSSANPSIGNCCCQKQDQ